VPSFGILLGAPERVEFGAALLSSIVLGQEEKSSVQLEVCYQRTKERAEMLLWSEEAQAMHKSSSEMRGVLA
jgi:hypothetical protein